MSAVTRGEPKLRQVSPIEVAFGMWIFRIARHISHLYQEKDGG